MPEKRWGLGTASEFKSPTLRSTPQRGIARVDFLWYSVCASQARSVRWLKLKGGDFGSYKVPPFLFARAA